MKASELRPGMGVIIDGKLGICVQSVHVTPGNLRAVVPIEHELMYDEKKQKGYISVKGMGLEARTWMITKIGEICSSKNIVIQEGVKPEPGCFKVLNEKLKDGKFTIEFECK